MTNSQNHYSWCWWWCSCQNLTLFTSAFNLRRFFFCCSVLHNVRIRFPFWLSQQLPDLKKQFYRIEMNHLVKHTIFLLLLLCECFTYQIQQMIILYKIEHLHSEIGWKGDWTNRLITTHTGNFDFTEFETRNIHISIRVSR